MNSRQLCQRRDTSKSRVGRQCKRVAKYKVYLKNGEGSANVCVDCYRRYYAGVGVATDRLRKGGK